MPLRARRGAEKSEEQRRWDPSLPVAGVRCTGVLKHASCHSQAPGTDFKVQPAEHYGAAIIKEWGRLPVRLPQVPHDRSILDSGSYRARDAFLRV